MSEAIIELKDIRKSFFKDEEDALEYYRDKVLRADEYGAVEKKDKKFLEEYSKPLPDESSEDVDI